MRDFGIAILMILGLCAFDSQAGKSKCFTEELNRLDSVLSSERPDSKREIKISGLKAALTKEIPDSSRYSILRDLYREYRLYRCDSAMLIAGKRLEIARRTGDVKRINSASLNMAECYNLVGDPHSALVILDSLPRKEMQAYHLKYLYNLYGKTFRNLASAEVIPDIRVRFESKADAYGDSAIGLFSNDELAFHRLNASKLADKKHYKEALRIMLDAERRFGLKGANENSLVSSLYRNLGNEDKAIEYMARAALADMEEGNRTHASLMNLAVLLNQAGDIDRAYRYIRVALEDASDAQARGLVNDILATLPLIDDSYELHEKEKTRWRFMLGGAIIIIGLLLGAMLIVTRLQLKKNRDARRQTAIANARLEETNRQLNESNEQKTIFLNEFFAAYSDAIEQRKKLRRHISSLLKTGMRDKALDVATSRKNDESSILDMYARFDNMVLSLNPGFIARYNEMVSDKNRVYADSGLTSEARIYALTTLGITSSGEIARLLHLSPQTVYNYRSRLKSWGFN